MYAVVLRSNVIDIIEQLCEYPPDQHGNTVDLVEIPIGQDVQIGMVYHQGEFYSQQRPLSASEEIMIQLDEIKQEYAHVEEAQLMMMEAMADQYEQGLEQDLINMEVQATIYEAVMALGGGEV